MPNFSAVSALFNPCNSPYLHARKERVWLTLYVQGKALKKIAIRFVGLAVAEGMPADWAYHAYIES